MAPSIIHHPLHRADGSTTFSDSLYTILSAVNGPVEVQRRDELPEEALVDVHIRPLAGVGGPRERWLENRLSTALRRIVLVHLHPRTLIQITLQILREPKNIEGKGAAANAWCTDVAVLPSLWNAAFLALVDGGLPLASTVSAVLAGVQEDGRVVVDLEEGKQLGMCKSLHAMAFDMQGGLLLDESAGHFDLKVWDSVSAACMAACAGALASTSAEDEEMDGGLEEKNPWLRRTLEDKARSADAWRLGT